MILTSNQHDINIYQSKDGMKVSDGKMMKLLNTTL